MPTEAVVTDEEIIAAGHRLVERGKRVTGHTIRQIVGKGDAKRLMAIWQASETANAAAPPPVKLPAAFEDLAAAEAERVTAGVHALVIALWQIADRLTEERVSAAVASLGERLAEQSVDLQAAGESLEKAESERDAVVAESNRRGEAIIECGHRSAAANGRMDEMRNELLAGDLRVQEAVAETQRTRTRAREDVEHSRALMIDAERRAASAEGRLGQAAAAVAALETRLVAAEEAARRAEQDAQSAMVARAAAEGERNAAIARATAAEQRLERRDPGEAETVIETTRHARARKPTTSE